MATTSRKKKPIPEKKPEVTKELPKEVQDGQAKEYLDAEHLKNLEIMARDLENAKLTMAVEEQNLQNLLLSLELLHNKIEKQKQAVSVKASKYESVKVRFSSFKKNIWPLYGLKEDEGMGYDPVSGLIKRQ